MRSTSPAPRMTAPKPRPSRTTQPCRRCRTSPVDVHLPDGRVACFDCLTFAERVAVLADTYRGRYGSPAGLQCRFCGQPACVIVALSDGCTCYPDDRVQALCCQHAERSTPLGAAYVIAAEIHR